MSSTRLRGALLVAVLLAAGSPGGPSLFAQALSAYSRALELLDQRLDDMFIGTHGSYEIERRTTSPRETVASLRTGRLPQRVVIE